MCQSVVFLGWRILGPLSLYSVLLCLPQHGLSACGECVINVKDSVRIAVFPQRPQISPNAGSILTFGVTSGELWGSVLLLHLHCYWVSCLL